MYTDEYMDLSVYRYGPLSVARHGTERSLLAKVSWYAKGRQIKVLYFNSFWHRQLLKLLIFDVITIVS